MAVQAPVVEKTSGFTLNWRNLVVTLLFLLIGAALLVLGGSGTQPGDEAAFTDQVLGTLFRVPARATLYLAGAVCFFAAGMRLFRLLPTVRS
ncbi:MAG: hypothetical protein EHM56_08265, partial [Chloroflexi bacterium]